jgi:dTDP-glucose pyrophosphorylase
MVVGDPVLQACNSWSIDEIIVLSKKKSLMKHHEHHPHIKFGLKISFNTQAELKGRRFIDEQI